MPHEYRPSIRLASWVHQGDNVWRRDLPDGTYLVVQRGEGRPWNWTWRDDTKDDDLGYGEMRNCSSAKAQATLYVCSAKGWRAS